MDDFLYGSVCRIADFPNELERVEPLAKPEWETGDYVVGTVSSRPSSESRLEAPNGWTIEPLEGEKIVGAFGKRHATRGIVGDWQDIEASTGRMHVIGGGGIFGKATSVSPTQHQPIQLEYTGHVQIEDSKTNMCDYAPELRSVTLNLPVILVLGTSMSSGKTMTARVLVRALREMGHTPISCKLSGSGRYHDIRSMKDAGAAAIYDFVDAGLPTTVVPEETYRKRMESLLARIEDETGDVLVAEIGASPLEPYHGDTGIELLQENVQFSVATATDPYSIVGLRSVLDVPIDLVAGIATNTVAGIELIEELSKVPALNLQLEREKEQLKTMMDESLKV